MGVERAADGVDPMRCSIKPAVALRAVARDDGQALTELVLAVPAFLIALVVVVNVLSFIAVAAQFDRAVGDWARANVANPRDPAVSSAWSSAYLTGPVKFPPAGVMVSARGDLASAFDTRKVTFTLVYMPFGTGLIDALGLKSVFTLRRVKTLTYPHYRARVVL